MVRRLTRLDPFEVIDGGAPAPDNTARTVVVPGELFVERPAQGDAGAEAAAARERTLLASLLEKTEARLADPEFRSRAPAAVVQQTEAKAVELAGRLRKIEAALAEGS
jgi:valyl-tRNA synthetase